MILNIEGARDHSFKNFCRRGFLPIISIQSNGTAVSTTHCHQQSIPCCFPSLSSLLLLILLLSLISLVGSFYFVIIVVCVIWCVFVLSSDLLCQILVPGAVLLSQKTRHCTRQSAFYSAFSATHSVFAQNAEIYRAIGKILVKRIIII